jgi:hypothetical protein
MIPRGDRSGILTELEVADTIKCSYDLRVAGIV